MQLFSPDGFRTFVLGACQVAVQLKLQEPSNTTLKKSEADDF